MIGRRDAYSHVAAVTMGKIPSQGLAWIANEYEPSPNHARTWNSPKPESAMVRRREVADLVGVEWSAGLPFLFSCAASKASASSRVREFLNGREAFCQTERAHPGTGMRVAQKRITNADGRMQAHNSRTNGSPRSRRLVPITVDTERQQPAGWCG